MLITMKITNITATAHISNNPLDLNKLAKNLWNCIYNPAKFNALILKRNTTSLIFKTGKIVIVGSKSPEEAKRGARHTARIIQKITTTRIFCSKFTIQNIVACDDLGFKPDLPNFVEFYSEYKPNRLFCVQDHESFAPAIRCYKDIRKNNLLANIFYSGKIVYTGSRDKNEIEDYAYLLPKILRKFKKVSYYQHNSAP